MADAHKNFAYGTILTAPSPATSGTSLVVNSGQGANFPAVSFNATIWPAGVQPTTTNAEIVRVTAISTDTFTITRTQESTSARTVIVGDQIAATITAKTLTDVEGPLAAWTDYSATSTIVGWSSFTTKKIFYRQVGKTIDVMYHLQGTSNSTAITFTVPVAFANHSQTLFFVNAYARDNNVLATAYSDSYVVPDGSTQTLNIEKTPGNGWTNSGTKGVGGSFTYESI